MSSSKNNLKNNFICLEESLSVAPDGGALIVYFNDLEIISVMVPKPNFSAEKASDSTSMNDEYFSDDFGNNFRIDIYSSMTGLYYTIEAVDIEDQEKAKEFCSGLSVKFESNEINPYEEEETTISNSIDAIPLQEKFFSIKLSRENGITTLLDFYSSKNTEDVFIVDGLTQLKDKVELGSIIYITAGGDKSNTKLRKLNYLQGLYGIAKVIEPPFQIPGRSKSAYMINLQFIYFFDKVISRDEFYPFFNTKNIPYIGAMTKGEKTQAISRLDNEQFQAVLDASIEITGSSKNNLYSLFPWLESEFKSIAVNEYNLLIDDMPPGLNIENIAKAFSAYLTNYSSDQTSTLVGIFGKWGRGKTYFYDKVKKSIESDSSKEKTFYFCKFQPWKYQKQESAWAYLYEILLHGYMEKNRKFPKIEYKEKEGKWKYYWKYIKEYFKEIWAKFKLNLRRVGYSPLIGYVLTIGISAFWIFSSLDFKLSSIGWLFGILGFGGIFYLYKTYSFVTKNKQTAVNLLETYGKTKDYSNHLGFQNEIEKEITYLLEEYIDRTKERLVLFIDDLDRCDEQMIINILDGLRLVLDNPSINSRLTIITAIDEDILSKAIEHKYFHENINPEVDSEKYIEKFFLLGIKLTRLQENDIEELVDLYTDKLNNLLKEASPEETNNVRKTSSMDIMNMPQFYAAKAAVALRKIYKDKISGGSQDKDEHPKVKDTKVEDSAKATEQSGEQLESGESHSMVLNKDEILSIKKYMAYNNPSLELTPRKINIIIHRYLLLKALIFTVMSEETYQNLQESELVKLLVNSQREEGLEEYIKHYLDNKTPKIKNILSNSESDEIDRNDFIMLVMFAEMVSPF